MTALQFARLLTVLPCGSNCMRFSGLHVLTICNNSAIRPWNAALQATQVKWVPVCCVNECVEQALQGKPVVGAYE